MGTFGKKYVLLGGMLTPAAAISCTWLTGVPRRRKAASYGPSRTRSTASWSVRE